jgi:hypothetical protein
LNFHFVEDNKKEFSFLNIRRINRLTKKYIIRGGSYFHVRKLQDLAGWDGRKDILLTITTERGKERELIALARALPKGNVAVHITFGYLSHPAILLREFGINVVPVYLNREIKEFQI